MQHEQCGSSDRAARGGHNDAPHCCVMQGMNCYVRRTSSPMRNAISAAPARVPGLVKNLLQEHGQTKWQAMVDKTMVLCRARDSGLFLGIVNGFD
jgi:hypothetical protein